MMASGSFILCCLRMSAVLSLIACSSSMTRASLMKLGRTSRSFSVAVFQQSSSISVMAEMQGWASVNNPSMNFSATGGNCCCRFFAG